MRIDNSGEYIVDSTKATCDRLEIIEAKGGEIFRHQMMKLHILVQYIFTLGLVSILTFFVTQGDANDSPQLRNHLLSKEKIEFA